mmetsp:Transcript_1332/g.3101  ORF Transcript_1332/g.3101 Transcript_1332/m.3101 type:complete len:226 (+) Transcript_1332:592-1269(+)
MKPLDASAILVMRSMGVVGVDSSTRSTPFSLQMRDTSYVSSSGMSGISNPLAPAAAISLTNASTPFRRMGLKYWNSTTGALRSGDTRVSIASTLPSVVPFSSARVAAAWMMGPSASGSEYGTPSSMTSAPASSRMRSAFSVASRLGSPAQMKGMNAHWFFFFRAANVSGMDTRVVPVAAAARTTGEARRAVAEVDVLRADTRAPAKAAAEEAAAARALAAIFRLL